MNFWLVNADGRRILVDSTVSSSISVLTPAALELLNECPSSLADYILHGDKNDPRKLIIKDKESAALLEERVNERVKQNLIKHFGTVPFAWLVLAYANYVKFCDKVRAENLKIDDLPISRRSFLRNLLDNTAAGVAGNAISYGFPSALRRFGIGIKASIVSYESLTEDLEITKEEEKILRDRIDLYNQKCHDIEKAFSALFASFIGSTVSNSRRISWLKQNHELLKQLHTSREEDSG